MNKYIDPSASMWWLVLFALGWVMVIAGMGIYFKYRDTHTEEQDSNYLKIAVAGTVFIIISVIALWP